MSVAGHDSGPRELMGSEISYRLSNGTLAAQVLVAQEAEQRRFSREMHDDLAQKVALLQFQIEAMRRKLERRDGAIAELDCLRGSVAALGEDLHRICHRLHPVVLDKLGLVAGVEFLCDEYARMGGGRPNLVCEGISQQVPSNVALCLYRMVQEALSNCYKYARATQVSVELSGFPDGIRAIVSDNGCGFEASEDGARSGLGLTFICERVNLSGGQCSINSAVGQGTIIEAFVPFFAAIS